MKNKIQISVKMGFHSGSSKHNKNETAIANRITIKGLLNMNTRNSLSSKIEIKISPAFRGVFSILFFSFKNDVHIQSLAACRGWGRHYLFQAPTFFRKIFNNLLITFLGFSRQGVDFYANKFVLGTKRFHRNFYILIFLKKILLLSNK